MSKPARAADTPSVEQPARFRLHDRTRVRDASGRIQLRSVDIAETANGSESSSLLFIDNDEPVAALRDVLAASAQGRAFCIVPVDMTVHASGVDRNAAGVGAEGAEGAEGVESVESVERAAGTGSVGDVNDVNDVNDVSGVRDPRVLDDTRPSFQCLSSGSTGSARRIQRTHETWIASFRQNALSLGIGVDDCYAVMGNLSHSLPLYAALEAAWLGADLLLMAGLRPDRQLQSLRDQPVTIIYLTPTQARLLCRAQGPASVESVPGHSVQSERMSGSEPGENPSAPCADSPVTESDTTLQTVRWILCGGGRLDSRTAADLGSLFPRAGIIEFYGASETSFITTSNEHTPEGSVGRAYPGVSIRVLDERGVQTEQEGEIWVRSPYLFTGYVQGEWRDTRWRDGYLSIGELGRLDNQGWLYLAGRKSRQANVADRTVHLQDIEQVLLQHPAVALAVVLARPDVLRGEAMIAVVEGSGSDALRRELFGWIRHRLGAALVPKQIRFLQRLPLLHSGKPDLQQLQRWLERCE